VGFCNARKCYNGSQQGFFIVFAKHLLKESVASHGLFHVPSFAIEVKA